MGRLKPRPQLTPVRIVAITEKAVLVSVLVGEEEQEPWNPGWVALSQVPHVSAWKTDDVDLMEVPNWIVKRNSWFLPKE